MKNPLDNIKRYSEFYDGGNKSYIGEDKIFGEYVKYDDVENIIKHIMQEHELQLDKEYERGYDKGLDAAYESATYRKD